MCLVIRRQQIILGMNGAVQLYSLDPQKESGHIIDQRKPFVAKHHSDIVPCVVCHESRIYTGG